MVVRRVQRNCYSIVVVVIGQTISLAEAAPGLPYGSRSSALADMCELAADNCEAIDNFPPKSMGGAIPERAKVTI